MLTPQQLKEYRKRTFVLLLERLDKSTPMLIDYQIDSALRNLLDLPDRPSSREPYIGWMILPSRLPITKMSISLTGIKLIKDFEGFRSKAYLCPANVWTIGYGHTASAKPGMVITKKHAEILLRNDLKRFEDCVNQKVEVKLNQNQFDALVSFTFNVGSQAFGDSTLLLILNQAKYYLAAKEFHRWVYANKRKLPGLVRRRQAEYDLFTKP